MSDQQFFIVESLPEFPDDPTIATIGRKNAERILEKDFDGEGSITPVTQRELVEDWGFDLQQVLNDHMVGGE